MMEEALHYNHSANEQRNLVLRGGFQGLQSSAADWSIPKWKLMVFVSSTFTDTVVERNIILEKILPRLKAVGLVKGIQVIFVDMRWGVRDENTLDHKTWVECCRELFRCRSESAGIFFISLQSDKLGYAPLPKYLKKESIDNILKEATDDKLVQLCKKWYLLDTNASPPQYILRNLLVLNDDSYWKDALPNLVNFLRDTPFDEESCEGLLVGRSVTEWEVKTALSPASTPHNSTNRSYWFHRTFSNLYSPEALEDDSKWLYFDAREDLRMKYFIELKNWMKSRFLKDHVQECSHIPFSSYVKSDEIWNAHISSWEIQVDQLLMDDLNSIVQLRDDWNSSGCGLGIIGSELSEMLHHCEWALKKCIIFEGREELLSNSLKAIIEPQEANENSALLKGICLALIGGSGCGKTAVMAKLAACVAEQERQLSSASRPVIIRFCGTSPGSKDGLHLMKSIILQLHHLFNVTSSTTNLSNFDETVTQFHSLLSQYPVILFIDSLDQLSDNNLCRSQISFLKGLKPHKDTRIIVSALPDEKNSNNEWIYCYGSHSRLIESKVIIIEVPSMSLKPNPQNESHLIKKSTESKIVDTIIRPSNESNAKPVNKENGPIGEVAAVKNEPTFASKSKPTTHAQKSFNLFDCVGSICGRKVASRVVDEDVVTNPIVVKSSSKIAPIDDKNELIMSPMKTSNSTNNGAIIQNASSTVHTTQEVLPEENYYIARNEAENLLITLLRKKNRKLNKEQFDYVKKQIAVEPTALYVDLAVRVVSLWTSSTTELKLAGGVKQLINQLFDDIERNYGSVLTRSAFAFITLSVQGVNDEEIEDLLSLDDEVLNNVFQYSSAGVRRLPTHVWVRLRGELQGLIVERDAGCLVWYHRQLWEVAATRYSDVQKKYYHTILAKYFGGIVSLAIVDDRKLTMQPLFISSIPNESLNHFGSMKEIFSKDCMINRRRCVEATHHMLAAGMIFEIAAELCRFESICCRIKCEEGFSAVLHLAKASLDLERQERERQELMNDWEIVLHDRIKHYSRWLLQDIHRIKDFPVDCFLGSSLAQPIESVVRNDALNLYKSTQLINSHNQLSNLESKFTKTSWTRSYPLGSKKKFTALLNTLTSHGQGVTRSTWSPDGTRIASSSYDKLIIIWDSLTGVIMNTLSGHTKDVFAVAWSPDSNKLASASADNTAGIWDSTSGSLLITLTGHTDKVHGVSWSYDNVRVATASFDKTIKIWNASNGTLLMELIGHENNVHSTSWCHSSNQIASASQDGSIKIWNSVTGELIKSLKFEADSPSGSLTCAWSPDDQFIASGYGKKIIIWDVQLNGGTGVVINTLEEHTSEVRSVAWSLDGSKLASASFDYTSIVWKNVTSNLHSSLVLRGHENTVRSVSWNPDCTKLTTCSFDKTVRVWDMTYDHIDYSIDGHSGWVYSASWNQTGSMVFSGGKDASIIVWNSETFEKLATLNEHQKDVNVVLCSHDGKYFATGSFDKTIIIWDTVSLGVVARLEGHDDSVKTLSWSPDDSKLASGSNDNTIRIWDVQTGMMLLQYDAHGDVVQSVDWSSNGLWLASGGGDSWDAETPSNLKLWNASDGSLIKIFSGHGDTVNCVSFTLDSIKLASASSDRLIKIWDITSGSVILTLEGHNGSVFSISWAKDNKKLVSSSKDSKIKVWNTNSGELVNTLTGHTHEVNSVQWCPNSSRILSSSMDYSVRIWDSLTDSAVNNLDFIY
eukprot:gene4093-5841_t